MHLFCFLIILIFSFLDNSWRNSLLLYLFWLLFLFNNWMRIVFKNIKLNSINSLVNFISLFRNFLNRWAELWLWKFFQWTCIRIKSFFLNYQQSRFGIHQYFNEVWRGGHNKIGFLDILYCFWLLFKVGFVSNIIQDKRC